MYVIWLLFIEKSCRTMMNNNKLLDLVNISSGIIVHAKCLFCKDQVESANGNRLREGTSLRVLKMKINRTLKYHLVQQCKDNSTLKFDKR